jgi:predicted metal-dependent RNase/intein/homing endonuclease
MEILEKVKSILPKEAISKIELEGSEIIVYTKDKNFFVEHEEIVKKAVEELKKRIEIRPESSLCLDQEYTKQKIMEIVPKEANIKTIYFEPERSIVIIAAEKPGLVIGKGGETFKQIKKETFWVPRIERVPPIKSEIIEGIRKVIHTEVKFRKEFLNKVGEAIFSERKTNRDWIRVIGLGSCREVGRSCFLIETPKSKVLVDCGINVGGTNSNVFPYFQTKEFDYNELDAIIVSHSHLDHLGCVPMLYEHGYDGPLYLTTPTIDLATLLWLDYIDVMQKNAVNPLFTARGVKEAVKHSIPLEYGEVSDVAPDVRLTFQNAGHVLGSALIHLHIGEGLHNIVYACDMKFGKTPLLDPAFTNFQRVETLIIESTYGGVNDVMPPRDEAEKQLMEVINKTMERNGIALIPSVDYSEPIMIMNDEHIKIVNIGEFCDKLFEKAKEKWFENGCEIANVKDMNIKVPVFNPTNYKTEFKKLSKVIRHKINEPLYEITLETGRKCRITASHSIFTLRNGKIVPEKIKNLKVGDFIISPRSINSSRDVSEVDVLDAIKNSKFSKRVLIDKVEIDSIEKINEIISNLLEGHLQANRILGVELTEEGKKFIKLLQHKLPRKIRNPTYEWVKNKKLPSLKFLKYVLEFCGNSPITFLTNKRYVKCFRRVPIYLLDKNLKYKNSYLIPRNSSKFKLPPILKLNKELARLLGYFIADGCYGNESDGIILTQNIHETDKIEDIIKCMKIVFHTNFISKNLKKEKNALEIKGGGLLGYILFSHVFGIERGVDKKRVPEIVFNCPREIKKEFIKGWLLGDGSISSDHITINTVNEKLASDLAYLFLQLGYVASIIKVKRKSWSKRGYIFNVTLSGSQLKKLAKEMNLPYKFEGSYSSVLAIPVKESGVLELTKHEVSKKGRIGRERLKMILRRKPSKKIEKLINSDFSFLRIKEIKRVKPTSEFVYDLSVEGYENFIGGCGGIFLHNSFAVERAQDVMAILVENNFQYPVFIDGMIWDATGIYTAYPEYMSRAVQRKIFSGKDPFVSDIFKRVASPQEREKVLEQRPCVIISTSGMLVGGPAINYLQNLAEDPRNTLIFVGYQGEGTLGRRIQKGWKEIPMKTENGKTITINLQMEVQTIDGLSGHSDKNQLLSFIHRLTAKPDKVIIVHGENQKALELARSIHKLFRVETVAPRNLEAIRLK